MKVVFATKRVSKLRRLSLVRPNDMLRHLPCKVVECYSAADVRKHVKTADVVLLDFFRAMNLALNYIHYWKDLTFLNELDIPVGWFYWGVWPQHGKIVKPMLNAIKIDFYLALQQEIVREFRQHWLDDTFWCLSSMAVQNYNVPRDIDILLWGTVGIPSKHTYPYREFLRRELKRRIIKKIEDVDPWLSTYSISIGGRKYKYARLRRLQIDRPSSRQMKYGYYGPKLHELVSRAKICPTGPHRDRIPLGKYFENAACGAVTMSIRFVDDAALGFEHGKTIWFTDRKFPSYPRFSKNDIRFPSHWQEILNSKEHDFFGDLAYLLEHQEVIQEISNNARELIRTRHTPEVRALGLYKFLCERVEES